MRKADLAVFDEVLDRVAKSGQAHSQRWDGAAMNEFNRKERE